ncbi:hypothetical protein ACET3Z_010367 [Daucus carota]
MKGNDTTLANTKFLQWNSPIPYLYGGLGVVLGLITVALMFLACSPIKTSSSTSDDREEELQSKDMNELRATEPSFVVVMAGQENPTCLAKPKGPCLCAGVYFEL